MTNEYRDFLLKEIYQKQIKEKHMNGMFFRSQMSDKDWREHIRIAKLLEKDGLIGLIIRRKLLNTSLTARGIEYVEGHLV